ncbi:MFS transporter [Liquorilactobacillus satsumensis]|uniref:Sugar transporter n=1 Tax=Liquorilactobacillus satsumensis DSM 16230 = JCM 12392 TaxID=1423801 RepID=A0A0R1UUF3_9LACO|nr:MFS transporter [Liquorilactobacillus satsumensis]KRL96829.1 sugar transporter [Liquorilactobacillus satsumensis DSM 16230 = JCM 12392]MCC7666431.1 MFS transporter [Liquorilactobacillus satsumensis]MCP9312989.1 MFS transporter [Liquorilactobacillus satsumensis]MCP9328935.1 MFS transporter [Liquorilactobacillus satsumensis]MCP9357644.1 MFS transporter [Liquorilactobacillus satsumensis]
MEMQNVAELQKRIDRTHESPLFYKIFALVAGGMFLDAADVYMASAVVSSVFKSGWSTLAQNSYFLSGGFLGLFIGSLIAGFIGDLKGRRVAYQVNLLLFGGFTFLAAFAPNMWVLIICRLCASIGLGSEIVTGYSMVNEFAPIHNRGKWCAGVSLIANCGAPLTLLLCTLIIPRFGWRVMFAGIGIAAAILWYLRRDIPESPRWLMVHGKNEQAETVIKQLEVNGSRTAMQSKKATPVQHSLGISLFVAIVAVSAVNICQYTFTSWTPTLLVKRGINISSSLGLSTLMMLGAPVGCALGAYLVDRIGRKKTIVPAFLLTAVFGMLYAQQASTSGVVIVGFLLTTCFYVLMASVVAVYVAELFTTAFRFRGAGISNGIAKLFTVAMPLVVAWMLQVTSVEMIFWTISAIALFAGVVVWTLGTETNQRKIG